MKNIISELSESMDVREHDVKCFAQSIADSIRADKAAEHFIDANDENKAKFIEAYAANAVRKFNRFNTKILTNSEARYAFALSIFNDIKSK